MFCSLKPLLLIAVTAGLATSAAAATVRFTGTRTNVNFLNPPGTGRCAPLNTISINPTNPSASGTSNFGAFAVTASHCIAGPPNPANPVRQITDGLFSWDFASGGSLFGTYTGTASFADGVATGAEDLIITGGTGRFAGASGSIVSRGTLGFGQVDGRPVGIFNGTVEGTITAAAIPEPASWAMMIAGFAGIGLASRRRRSDLALVQQGPRSGP